MPAGLQSRVARGIKYCITAAWSIGAKVGRAWAVDKRQSSRDTTDWGQPQLHRVRPKVGLGGSGLGSIPPESNDDLDQLSSTNAAEVGRAQRILIGLLPYQSTVSTSRRSQPEPWAAAMAHVSSGRGQRHATFAMKHLLPPIIGRAPHGF
jgi:hypothetical protein